MTDFPAEDFIYTAHVLRTESDAVVKATLSNNFGIILNALDIAAGGVNEAEITARALRDRFDKIDAMLATIGAQTDTLLFRSNEIQAALHKQDQNADKLSIDLSEIRS